MNVTAPKTYRLLGPDGPYSSVTQGVLGGHARRRVYGRLDCPSALLWLAKGHYAEHRVFFASEDDAITVGFRPCGRCLPEDYRLWKQQQTVFG